MRTPNKKSKALHCAAAALTLLASAMPAAAQSPWICSLGQYMECNMLDGCADAPPDPAAFPAFLTIDLEAGVVRATEPQFADRTADILESDRAAGRLVLAGIQGGRGWSLTLIEETGEMSLAISDPDAGILISGRCIARAVIDP